MRKTNGQPNPSSPDPLKTWKDSHPSQSTWLALLESDWPGAQEICRRFIEEISLAGLDAETAETMVDNGLSASLTAYRKSLNDDTISDPQRLLIFSRALASRFIELVGRERSVEQLVIHWLPDSLAKVLEPRSNVRESSDAT